MKLPTEWKELLTPYLRTGQARDLAVKIENEYKSYTICPPKEKLFSAFSNCLPQDVKVVILGQDPYHGLGQAMGMCFSVEPNLPSDVRFPPSLMNIIKEIKAEYGECNVESGDLTSWAQQGVLLLNTCLTVKLGQPLSHANIGWDGFTKSVISEINKLGNVIFVLWGSHAQNYQEFITNKSNHILKSAHPSPLSASRGFLGNGHFKKVNEILRGMGKQEIVW